MSKKTLVFCLFMLAAAIGLRAQETSFRQADTLVFRRDSLDTSRGVIRSIPDSVFFLYVEEGLFNKVNLDAEMRFSALTIKETEYTLAQKIAKPQDLLEKARRLRMAYRFQEALQYANLAMESSADEEILSQAAQEAFFAQNGMNMTDNCSLVNPLAKKAFSLKDFFLYFPFADKSFRASPNVFDSGGRGGSFIVPTYAPKDSRQVFFSAADEVGAYNIYMSENRDSCWSAPVLLGEGLVSAGNEIAPVLSPDGKTLFFASDGLFGMGGYDLYASHWDERTQSWGDPVNLGFPFSSPADDYMLMQTEDHRYTIFASNRECSRDSVYIYVLQYEFTPAKTSITDPADLLEFSMLEPNPEPGQMDNTNLSSQARFDSGAIYMTLVSKEEELRDKVKTITAVIEALNQSIAEEQDPNVREALKERLAAKQAELAIAREDLAAVMAEVEEFTNTITSTSSLNPTGAADVADTDVVGAGEAYVFAKKRMGGNLKYKVLTWVQNPSSNFNASSSSGRFGYPSSLPQDLYYQILFLESNRHIQASELNGLGPVYERQTRRLHYQYYAGVFVRYQDALHALNTVRMKGFPDVEIVAYNGAEAISIEEALEMESAIVEADLQDF